MVAFNWVDVVLIILLLLFAWYGFRRGFLVLFAELLGAVIAFIVALALYHPLSNLLRSLLGITPAWGKAIGFLLIFMLVEMIYFALIRRLYAGIPETAQVSLLNRILGMPLGLLEGIVILALVLVLLVSLPYPGRGPDQVIMGSAIGSRMVEGATWVEQKALDIFGGAVQDTFNLLTIRPESKERVQLPFRTTHVHVDAGAEQQMLTLVNRERTKRHLTPLRMDPQLQAAARAYSRQMLAEGFFAHISPSGSTPEQRIRAAGVRAVFTGENLALAPNVQIAHSGLMNSPGHRANILSPRYHRVGIGALAAPPHGIMFAQEFAN